MRVLTLCESELVMTRCRRRKRSIMVGIVRKVLFFDSSFVIIFIIINMTGTTAAVIVVGVAKS
jgi:predicted membrane protein